MGKKYKIIDWSAAGNSVRLYLGDPNLQSWWGDDWDDNGCSDQVYDEFVIGTVDFALNAEAVVFDAMHDDNRSYCKQTLALGHMPCIAMVSEEVAKHGCFWGFTGLLSCPDSKVLFLGSLIDEDIILQIQGRVLSSPDELVTERS